MEQTYTFVIEARAQHDYRIWMPVVGGEHKTETYDGTAEEYAKTVLENWLIDNPEEEDTSLVRIIVWQGRFVDMDVDSAATVLYGDNLS